MTITVTPTKTRAQMLAILRERCGLHATIGSAPALNDLLTEAHEYVYEQLDDGYPVTSTLTLTANTPTYPAISTDNVPISRGSIQTLWVERSPTERYELPQGIDHSMRADTAQRGIPEAWDARYAGTDDGVWTMEFWPTPDQTYTAYIDHNRVLTRFEQDADVPSVPYRLVLAYAIAMGKAHYGKADADTAGQAFKTMLYKEHVSQKENRRFIPNRRAPLRARVVSTAGGFRQVWD